MFLKVIGPFGHEDECAVDTCGLSLGALFNGTGIHRVKINERDDENWPIYIPQRGDRIEIERATGDFGIFSGPIIASTLGVSLATATSIASVVSSLILSLALSAISRALTPKPKKAKLDSNHQEAFGIAGFQNTIGRGTPAFVPYGLNKIFGHVLSSGATLSPDGKQMWGRILYFMGDTGGDGIESISDVRIDGTSVSQYPNIGIHIRPGDNVQAVIPEFENLDSLYTPPVQSLDFEPTTQTGTLVIYTTVGNNVNRATLFILFPGGLYKLNVRGSMRVANVVHKIEIKPNSGGVWTELPQAQWTESTTSGIFKTYQIDFPNPDKWDIRVTTIQWWQWDSQQAFVATSMLFNVQETVFTNKTYPGWALLGLVNIPSKNVQSMQNMNVSAMVEGKRVPVPQRGGGSALQYTRKRCWIVRDMMTHPVVGMGSEIDASEIDDQQWLDAQDYYDEAVDGHAGQEVRDLCDVIVGEADWDWEWVKKVCGEARGRVIPSGSKWKYIIDKPDTPNILYTEGANIIDGSVGIEIAPPDKPFSEIIAQFRDSDKDYEDNFSPPIKDPEAVSVVQESLHYDTITRESQVQRENMIVFKRNFLERRRWSFLSPMGAIVSEAGDLDYIAERGIGNEGAYGFIFPAGSTNLLAYLPDVVTLKAGVTYALICKHARDNTTEYRTVTTAAGVCGLIDLSSPFIQSPEEGDTGSLGIQDIEHIITRAQELEVDKDGHIKQVRTEYIPAVYTQDPLPSKSARRFFGPVDNKPPIPIRYAAVTEQVTINNDGSTRSMLLFAVTPGLPHHGGIARGGLTDRIILANDEPGLDKYFIDAKVTVNSEQRLITGYDGVTRTAYVSVPFSGPPQNGNDYSILWERFGEFGGFIVEHSEDAITYLPFVNVSGTHYETDSQGVGPGLVYFKLTPFSKNSVQNIVAQHILPVNITGDLSAPAKPKSVTISSHLLNVQVQVTMQRPVAEDFASVDVELWRDWAVMIEKARFGSSADKFGSGDMNIICPFNLGARSPPEPYGSAIWARARAKDYSDNPLEGTPEYDTLITDSATPTILALDPNTIPGSDPVTVPTGLVLSSGVQVDPVDGNPKVYLQGIWNPNPESSISQYEFQYRQTSDVGPTPVTVRIVFHPQVSSRDLGVLGNTAYVGRVQAINGQNVPSGFTAWTPITDPANGRTAIDNTIPTQPSFGSVLGGFRLVSLFFNPPPNIPSFKNVEVWFDLAGIGPQYFAGESAAYSINFVHTGLQDETTYYYWIRSKTTSGVLGPFAGPLAATTYKIGPNDVVATHLITQSAQIDDAIIHEAHITGQLSANKISTGTLQATYWLGVGPTSTGTIVLDGMNKVMVFYDKNVTPRVVLGQLGPLNTDWGLQIFGATGALWFSATQGLLTPGLSPNAVNNLWEVSNDNEFIIAYGHDQFPVLISLLVDSEGGIMNIKARIKISPPFSGEGNGFDLYLQRDGVTIDYEWEKTSNGKHMHMMRFDAPSPGLHTYTLVVNNRQNTGWSFMTGAMRIEIAEIKR